MHARFLAAWCFVLLTAGCNGAFGKTLNSERAQMPTFNSVTQQALWSVSRITWTDNGRLAGRLSYGASESETFTLDVHRSSGAERGATCKNLQGPALLELCSELGRRDKELSLSIIVASNTVTFKESSPLYGSDAYERRTAKSIAWSSNYSHLLAGERLVRNDWTRRHPHEIAGAKIVEVGDEPGPVSKTEISILSVSGQKRIALALVDGVVTGGDWFKDQRVYFSAAIASENRTDIFEYDANSNGFTRVYSTEGVANSLVPRISPDGHRLALVLDVDNRRWGDFQSLVLVDLRSGAARRVTTDIALFDDDFFWSKDGQTIFARFRRGGFDSVVEIDLDGHHRMVRSGTRRYYSMLPSPDKKQVAYLTEDLDGKRDLRVYDLEMREEKTVLSVSDPTVQYSLSEWRQISWPAPGGISPNGFLFYPPNFDSTQKYPMIVDVHGGGGGSRLYMEAPITIGVNPGPLEWHAWAALGYLVFVPDYRSTGAYGPQPITEMYQRGVFDGLADAQDTIAGVEHLIKEGIADPTRVAILGHSAGGRRVFMALQERDNLFCAAILNDPIAPDPESFMYFISTGHLTGGSGLGILITYRIFRTFDFSAGSFQTERIDNGRERRQADGERDPHR